MELKDSFDYKNMNGDEIKLKEYEELLARRDQFTKEAASFLVCYTKEFGNLITGNFELKVECIKLKKMIGYCRRRLNRGLKIDADRMNSDIDREMQLYYAQLKDMTKDVTEAKNAKPVGAFRFTRSKKIYRRLMKILHPDVNKKNMENEELRELWERIVNAYNHSNVDELDDLEFLVRKKLEELGDEGFAINYDNLEERIERVERQINDIITTEPYTYKDLLEDEDRKAAHKELLKAEHDDYDRYLQNLKNALEDILKNGGTTIVWKMY